MSISGLTPFKQVLAGVQEQARKLAALDFELAHHPDRHEDTGRFLRRAAMMEMWSKLSDDLVAVIGPEAALCPFNALASATTFAASRSGRDPFSISVSALKKKADKARRKNPGIELLKSWKGN